jgi:hypothetical protein
MFKGVNKNKASLDDPMLWKDINAVHNNRKIVINV